MPGIPQGSPGKNVRRLLGAELGGKKGVCAGFGELCAQEEREAQRAIKEIGDFQLLSGNGESSITCVQKHVHGVIGSRTIPYLGYSRDEDGKIIQNQMRPPRTQKFCNSIFCATNRKHCASFSKKELQKVFHEFWNYVGRTKSYVTSLIDLIPKKHARVLNVSRRSGTYKYHLIKDKQKPVCKKMFLGSLGLGVHGAILG
ncbi:unnamed protein product [Brassicogethes aeneus]|uniref:Uncharacterized protein n=1 Tax=Brassicogethes aeneus TaxID=1431903 RepID=A0A9P0BJE9_BRAAE|nr:unnamed protein product [Brassicogethes aeneus]